MLQQVEAVYEGGVFRPLVPTGLAEHSHVTLDVALSKTERVAAISDEEFERQLSELSSNGPTLPADFSRADIYADHD
jgi:predicted DNA-binding antitoxin AbrB/MazE fold protein